MRIAEKQIARHGRTVDAVYYIPDAPHGGTVIFSHGYNGHKSDFAREAEYLAKNGVCAVTYTFCGGSTRDASGFPTQSMTLFTERDDLCAVMDDVLTAQGTGGTLVLFGGSQGGMVSVLAARERAAEIGGLALLFPALCIPDNWRTFYPEGTPLPSEVDFWGMKLGEGFIRTVRTVDAYEGMERFIRPVRLFHGTEDAVVPLAYSERAAALFPHAELTVYPGEGHGFSREAMDDVARRLLAFVRELRKK